MTAGKQRALHPFIATAVFEKDLRKIAAVPILVASSEGELHLLAEHEIGERFDGLRFGRPGTWRSARVARAGCKSADEANDAAIIERQGFAIEDASHRPHRSGIKRARLNCLGVLGMSRERRQQYARRSGNSTQNPTPHGRKSEYRRGPSPRADCATSRKLHAIRRAAAERQTKWRCKNLILFRRSGKVGRERPLLTGPASRSAYPRTRGHAIEDRPCCPHLQLEVVNVVRAAVSGVAEGRVSSVLRRCSGA